MVDWKTPRPSTGIDSGGAKGRGMDGGVDSEAIVGVLVDLFLGMMREVGGAVGMSIYNSPTRLDGKSGISGR